MTELSTTAQNKIKDLQIVNEATHVMIELQDQESVFKYILNVISENHPEYVIILNQNDPETNKLKVLDIYFPEDSIFKKGVKLLGFSPIGKTFNVKPEVKEYLEKGNLQKNQAGFTELLKGQFPLPVVRSLIKLLNIKNVYHLGLIKEKRIFAELQFYLPENSPPPKKHLIETIAGIGSSIIYQRELKNDLIKSQIQFKNLIMQSKDGIIISDNEGNITDWNKALHELTGISREEVIEKKCWEIRLDPLSEDKRTYFTPEEKKQIKMLFQDFSNFQNTEYFKDTQVKEIKTKHGDIKFIELSIFPIKSEDDNYFVAAIIRDITGKINYEKQILEQSRSLKQHIATKDKLFSIIGHDLKSPLANIVGFIEILRGEIGEDREVASNIARNIENSAYKISGLLDNLLQWSRIQTGNIHWNPEFFDLTEVYSENCELFKESADFKGIKMICPEENPVFVKADKNMVNTIFRNLINNAIKFTPEGGKIEIKIKKTNTLVKVQVKDNGTGIPEEELNDLFKTEKNNHNSTSESTKGSGLGLILCKEFIEMNKGEIGVNSKAGKGSEFYFTLMTK